MASELTLKALKATGDHNSAMLETILRIVQDVQTQGLKTDRRLGCLEVEVQSMAALKLPVSDTGDSEVRGHDQRSTDTSGSELRNVQTELKDVKVAIEKVRAEIQDGRRETEDVGRSVQSVQDKMNDVNVDIIDTKQKVIDMTSQLKQHVTEEVNEVTDSVEMTQQDHVDKMSAAQETLTSQMDRFTSAFENGNKKLDKLALDMENNKMAVEELNKKVQRLTLITVHANIKTKEDVTSVNSSVDRLNSVVKRSTENKLELEELKGQFVIGGDFYNFMAQMSQATIDQIVMENTITREIVQRRREEPEVYKCVFLARDYSKWKGTGQCQFSRVWYLDKAKTHVKGRVTFQTDNTIDVYLSLGRYPEPMGLKAANPVNVRVSARITDFMSRDELELGVRETYISEMESVYESGKRRDGWLQKSRAVCYFGGVSCDELESQHFVDEDTLMIAYHITVLP